MAEFLAASVSHRRLSESDSAKLAPNPWLGRRGGLGQLTRRQSPMEIASGGGHQSPSSPMERVAFSLGSKYEVRLIVFIVLSTTDHELSKTCCITNYSDIDWISFWGALSLQIVASDF